MQFDLWSYLLGIVVGVVCWNLGFHGVDWLLARLPPRAGKD